MKIFKTVSVGSNQRVQYNKTRESVDAYADMLFDLQQQILTSRATDFNKEV
jgi:hypothetical protein